jgi:tRNA(Ile)-lysidine synthase
MEYLRAKNITYFDDSTNSDPQYLRARMRTVMLPWLTESFGKEIAPGLCHIGEEAAELSEFLDTSTQTTFDTGVRGPFGVYWDLTDVSLHSIQMKFLVHKICDSYALPISRDAVANAAEMLLGGKANKRLELATHTLQIDRSRLFLVEKEPPFGAPCDPIRIALDQTVVWRRWKIQAVSYEGSEVPMCTWKDLWGGRGAIVVPAGEYILSGTVSSEVSKLWTEYKVPAFLRDMTPLVYFGGVVARELLTGRSPFASGRSGNIGMMRLLFLCG